MTHQQFSDEILMAYADGELDAETAQAVARALETDPAIAERVALFSSTATILSAAAQARPDDPLSPELEGKIAEIMEGAQTAHEKPSGEVLSFRAPASRSRAPAPLRYAMAASIALAIGLAGGYLLPRGYEGGGLVASLEGPAVSAALSALPSGERSAIEGAEIEVIATFTNGDSELCREFELAAEGQSAVVSVACMDGSEWQTRFAMASGPRDSTSYVPASSLAALDAFLASVGAEMPMDPNEEMAALNGLN